MVKFGDTIVAQKQNSAWAPYYLDYSSLKQVLEEHKQQQQHEHEQHLYHNDQQDGVSVTSLATSISLVFPAGTHNVTAEFLSQLHAQVESMVLFVLQEQGKIASDLIACHAELQDCLEAAAAAANGQLGALSPPHHERYDSLDDESLRSSISEYPSLDKEKLVALEDHYFRVGLHLLRLYQFVDVNVTGIRKILKKHDKLLPRSKLSVSLLSSLNNNNNNTESGIIPMSPSSSSRRGSIFPRRRLTAEAYGNALVKPLLRDECLGALTVTLEAGLQELHSLILQQLSFHDAPTPPAAAGKSSHRQHRRRISAPHQHQSEVWETNASGGGGDQLSPLLLSSASVPGNKRRASTLDTMGLLPPPPRAPNYHSSSAASRPLIILQSSSAQIHDRKSFRPSRSHSLVMMRRASGQFLGHNSSDGIMLQIQAARRRLQQTSSFVQLLAAPMMMVSDGMPSDDDESVAPDDDDDDDETDLIIVDEEEEQERERSFNFSNTLNLCSTLLYMCNYYIVAPTSATYAEKLGGTASMASMIIGMTPVAALVSTVLYSWWTSYSYKSALIFASSCSVLGNLFYAAGLPYDSLTLVIIGRLLNGFGSARAINRRYICDTFPREERTAASAAFVTAGALGMAAGPAIASVLHYTAATTDQSESQWNKNIYWQAENAPGWFMFGAWTIYLICLIRYFEDPPKKKEAGLKKTVLSLELTPGESNRLLGNGDTKNDEGGMLALEPPIWRNIPVMTTFFVYFVLKLVLEAVLSATAMLTEFYFGWHSGLVGVYLAAVALLVLPANLCVALLARSYDDRELIIGMQAVMFLGCVAILQYTDVYRLPQYIFASVVLFISTNALEGPNMSLLSKTIPKSWSTGIFNVGLLATEAGTLGRAIGDVLLTVFGSGGLEHLLNRTFGSFSVVSLVTLLFSYYFYDQLEPTETDD